MGHFALKHGGPSSSFNGPKNVNQSALRMDPSKQAQIRLNLGSRLRANARSADRAFAPNETNNTAYFPFSFLFTNCMTPIIRASGNIIKHLKSKYKYIYHSVQDVLR